MAQLDNNISLCTFNCRSCKNSLYEIYELCSTYNFIFLQEHWLLPNELHLLSQIHPNFYASAKSSVDIGEKIVLGRPYGGTAIIYKKDLAHSVTLLDTHDPRLSAVCLNTNIGPVLMVCVYMPTDTGDADCVESYVFTCSRISALYIDCNAVHLIVAGDFNCQPGARLYKTFEHFINDNNLVVSDLNRLNDVFTYCNDSGTAYTWIDHIACSNVIDQLVVDIGVLYNYLTSDHKPLFASFNVQCVAHGINIQPQSCMDDAALGDLLIDWSKVSDYDLVNYKGVLDDLLLHVSIPAILLGDSVDCNADIADHIDRYYNAVTKCIHRAAISCLPTKTFNTYSDYIVPGWNDLVQEKHQLARHAFTDWCIVGRPRQGVEFDIMKRTRAMFKLALRYCKQHEQELQADAYARSLSNKDYHNFWRDICKVSNGKSTTYATYVGGCSGETNIANMWMEHFKTLYNSVVIHDERQSLLNRTSDIGGTNAKFMSLHNIKDACRTLKLGKAVGYDKISVESIVNGSDRLFVHICLLFNIFIKHGILPQEFMKCVIIPLVKNKSGDISDANNYRAIAISTSFSKLFESVILDSINSVIKQDDHQFGFKKGHSTAICTNVMKETVDYYIQRGSHVFACFIDFNKAFDTVNYWKLCHMLLDDGVDINIVRILSFWFSNQQMCVRWHTTVSSFFNTGNGTRQGGVLSPILFARYILRLTSEIVNSGIGCNIGGCFVNVIAYADDIVLLAPAWYAMKRLLDIVAVETINIDMKCNTLKTVCMVYAPRNKRLIICHQFPQFMLDGVCLQFVEQFKYLGHILDNKLHDDQDINREIRNLFVRVNILLRRFKNCSKDVKIQLFRSYCICLYDISLWLYYSSVKISKLRSCYIKCIKVFFGYNRFDSVTQMLLNLQLPSFDTLITNCKLSFKQKWCSCNNNIVRYLNCIQHNLITNFML